MASIVQALTASGGTEPAGFLNDIIAQLWPNINVAGCQMVKDIVEPMFASMLPGPLATLHFVKLDLGNVPLRLSEVDVNRTETQGIKLDMNLDWDGNCDIELDGKMIPKVGIDRVKLSGRLSILLGPLTNVIPLIGAAQITFINPPVLKLNFTNAASFADIGIIERTIHKVILDIIASMAVLPNRFLVKLDAANDYFKTYQQHLGVIRLTVDRATGISKPKKSGAMGLLGKIAKDVPDCYCIVSVGAEKDVWRTSTKKNEETPTWSESHDFLVMDHDQAIMVDVQDEDVGGDDNIGLGVTTVKQLLLANGTQELTLIRKEAPTSAKLTIKAEFHNFVADAASFSAESSHGAGKICGLATVLIASALGLAGQRDELNPSVKVSWGTNSFQTTAMTYSAGVDIFNPGFDVAFKIPITVDMIANPAPFKIVLMNKKVESGSVEIPFTDILNAPNMVLANNFDVGSGAVVRACIGLRGTRVAQ